MRSNSGAIAILENGWTYLAQSTVASVIPGNGQGGTRVTIVGERLRGGGSAVVSVIIGGVSAQITSENDTVLVIVAGISSVAIPVAQIVITADSGAVTLVPDTWSYETPGDIMVV
ncbi:MAG: hypothetical protein COB48_13570, partial [Pseudoalteromonas sp.]